MISSMWESFQTTVGIKEPPPPPPPPPTPVSVLIGDGPSASAEPLLQLLCWAVRRVRSSGRTYAKALGALAAIGGAAGLLRHFLAARGGRRSDGSGGGVRGASPSTGDCGPSEDEIVFVDPADSRFTGYLAKMQRTKEEPFRAVLRELEELVAERAALQRRMGEGSDADAVAGGGSSSLLSSSATAAEAEQQQQQQQQQLQSLNERIEYRAKQADELLTVFVVSLDGLPVSGRPDLRERRRALVKSSMAMAARITPYLSSHVSASVQAHSQYERKDDASDGDCDGTDTDVKSA